MGILDRQDRRARLSHGGTGRLWAPARRGRTGGDVLAALHLVVPRRRGRRERELGDRARGHGLVRCLAARTCPRDPAGGGSHGRTGRCARPAALHGASRIRIPGRPVPGRRGGRSALPSRADCATARGRRRRVDASGSPALAPVHGQRPLRRGADVRARFRRPLPARRARVGEGPGSRRARRRPGRGDGDAGRCGPLVGHDGHAHRAARPDRHCNERRSRCRHSVAECASAPARPGVRRRGLAGDGVERRRVRGCRRAGGPSQKRRGTGRPANGPVRGRCGSSARLRCGRLGVLLEPCVRACGCVSAGRLARPPLVPGA